MRDGRRLPCSALSMIPRLLNPPSRHHITHTPYTLRAASLLLQSSAVFCLAPRDTAPTATLLCSLHPDIHSPLNFQPDSPRSSTCQSLPPPQPNALELESLLPTPTPSNRFYPIRCCRPFCPHPTRLALSQLCHHHEGRAAPDRLARRRQSHLHRPLRASWQGSSGNRRW